MKITVTGSATAEFAPELCDLALRVGTESGDRGTAVGEATVLAAAVGADIERISALNPSPLAKSAVQPLATRSWRPWNNEGVQLPLRHSAWVAMKLTWLGFQAMSDFIDRWGRDARVEVVDTAWRLTKEKERDERSNVLAAAVDDARDKASTLATAAGEGPVAFLELSDRLLSIGYGLEGGFTAKALAAPPGDGGVEISPADIELSATIQAIFTTD